jgi:diketogulonate reductase-like aldo/keto reductase
MERRTFGGLPQPVAAIGQGSWRLENAAETTAIAGLRRGLDLGLTHIDTAEMYGDGAAERIIGKAIAGRRDEVFLVSKVLPGNASLKGTIKACENSLRRLAVERLDCYLLHWRGPHPLSETIAAFERLKQEGKIGAWGVSNFDVADLDEVESIAGAGHPVCNQVLYHLEERAIEHAVIPWCERRGTAIVAYTPFGVHPCIFDGTGAQAQVLRDIAAAHGATPRQVALQFLLRRRGTFAIPKAADTAHLAENAGALRFSLTEAQREQIESAFPLGKRPRSLPMI